MSKLNAFNQAQKNDAYTDLRSGWTVKVHQKIKEGDKSRVQAFEGIIVSRKHGNEPGGTITVRKVSGGYGVEKTFPLRLPTITKIEVLKRSGTRRSKLYYLRDKTSRQIRKKMKTEVVSKESKSSEDSE